MYVRSAGRGSEGKVWRVSEKVNASKQERERKASEVETRGMYSESRRGLSNDRLATMTSSSNLYALEKISTSKTPISKETVRLTPRVRYSVKVFASSRHADAGTSCMFALNDPRVGTRRSNVTQ